MRKFLVLFVLLLPVFAPEAKPQDPRPSREIPACNRPERIAAIQQASVFLVIDRTRYSLEDEMILDVGILNNGRKPMYVYSKNGWGFNGFMLEFTDEAGRFVDPEFIDHVPPPPETKLNDPSLFVGLETDEFFGMRGYAKLKGFLKSPGKYTLRVSYESPASCGLYGPKVRALPILWRHDPNIISNSVSFEITP
jgi:hypothetical protein